MKFILVLTFINGCFHWKKNDKSVEGQTHESYLHEIVFQAKKELEMLHSDESSPIEIPKPQTLKRNPTSYVQKEWRYWAIMFPRYSDQAEKSNVSVNDDLKPFFENLLLSPILFDFHLKWEPCPSEVKENFCLSFIIKDPRWDLAPAEIRRPGDIRQRQGVATRHWNVVSEIYVLSNDKNEWVTQENRTHNLYGIQSGLTIFPLDWPSLDLGLKWKKIKATAQNFGLDEVALVQIKKLIHVNVLDLTCDGWHVKYKDVYGLENEVAWCQNEPIPRFIRNIKYVAVWLERR